LEECRISGGADGQGVYTVGGVCAFFPNIYLPDKIGRRYSMFYGNGLLMYVVF
jgi:hypothetical protein